MKGSTTTRSPIDTPAAPAAERADDACDLVPADAGIGHIGVLAEIDVEIAGAEARGDHPHLHLALGRRLHAAISFNLRSNEASKTAARIAHAALGTSMRPEGSISIMSPGLSTSASGVRSPRALAAA